MAETALTPERLATFPTSGVHLIEASAGTGKTYCLAHLYLRHVLRGRQLRQILAVTFTNAATEELRCRIRDLLQEALRSCEALLEGGSREALPLAPFLATSPPLLKRERLRLQLALRSLDELAIHTIHGYCRLVLEECALLTGQPLGFEVVEEEPALLEALLDWWRSQIYPLEGPRAAFYESTLGPFPSFQSLFSRVWLRTERPPFHPPPKPLEAAWAELEALEEEKRALLELWKARGEAISQTLLTHPALSRDRKKGYAEEELREALGEIDRWLCEGTVYETPESFQLLTKNRLAESLKKGYQAPEFQDPFFERCQHFWERLKGAESSLKRSALKEALAFVEERVDREKRRQALLTFDDLIRKVERALENESLCEALRQRFPVALIDEFQDTDPVQFRIFRKLYLEAPKELRLQLVMIGDPKQAIYGFRGADLFSYLKAREEAGGRWTLLTNWRSTPSLIAAQNRIFSQNPRPFLLEGIDFQLAKPAPKATYPELLLDGRPLPAALLWFLPAEWDERGRNLLTKEVARERIYHAVAREVVGLIEAGRKGRLRVKGEGELQPKEIAILVRRHDEGRELKKVLARYGVRAVAIERESVWESEAARSLLDLAEAIAFPEERRAARRGLASQAMALSPEELDRHLADEELWNRWLELLEESKKLLERCGFLPAFLHLMAESGMAERIATRPQPERFLTDLLHAAELVHLQFRQNPSLPALLSWLREQIEEAAAPESLRLRLEEDEALVRIATIHASKGLEWTVVFVPTMWDVRENEGELLFWHDQEGRLRITLREEATEEISKRAREERLSEELRLLYVALTRPRSRFYLVFGAIGQRGNHSGTSPLAYLLLPEAWREGEGVPLEAIRLERLQQKFGEQLQVVPLPEEGSEALSPLPQPEVRLALRLFRAEIDTTFTVTSFTALARNLPHLEGPRAGPAEEHLPFPLRFPAGPEVGAFLHRLLERLDFQQLQRERLEALVAEEARRFGLRFEIPTDPLLAWLEEIVTTPILEGLTLRALPRERQLREWPFDLATGRVDRERLEALLSELEPRGEKLPLSLQPFRGLVTGVADLVFEHEGRFYLADYKSNLLGRTFEDYRRERLEEAMRRHRYDLQYALYLLALHRFLGKTVPGYHYDRHFGGVLYLFLRGMRPEFGSSRGIFFVRPEQEVVSRLEELFRRGG